jgi:hypothetical protein
MSFSSIPINPRLISFFLEAENHGEVEINNEVAEVCPCAWNCFTNFLVHRKEETFDLVFEVFDSTPSDAEV